MSNKKSMKNRAYRRKSFTLAAVLCVVLSLSMLTGLTSCAGKYHPIESTEEEGQIIGKIGDYYAKYEELRYLALTFKRQMELTDGEGIWDNPETAELYRAELESAVYSAIKQDYALQTLCAEMGFTINEPAITEAVDKFIGEFVEELGGMRAYRKYLEENFMTDSFMRLTVATDYLENELRYAYIDAGIISNDASEIYDSIMNDDMFLCTVHIFISNEREDRDDAESLSLAQRALSELKGGADFNTIMEKYNEDAELDTQYGMYFTHGEVNSIYQNAASSLGYDEYSEILKTGGGYIIIRRLKPNVQYVMLNLSSLTERYQYAFLEALIEKCREELTFEPSTFCRELDLTQIR